jgi:hypothetical protein
MSLREAYLALKPTTAAATVAAPVVAWFVARPKAAEGVVALLHAVNPAPLQDATNRATGATSEATPEQQHPANPHECWGSRATSDATGAQQGTRGTQQGAQQTVQPGAVSTDAEAALLRVAKGGLWGTQQRNKQILDALTAAINRCCDARGDDPARREALLTECAAASPEHQADLLAHFTIEAARHAAPDPDLRVTCTACRHYRPLVYRCANHHTAGLLTDAMGATMAALPQHCASFAPRGAA